MPALFLQMNTPPSWLQQLTSDPRWMPFVVMLVAIIGAMALCFMKALFRHRERMAKIEHGIDPDQKPEAIAR